MDSARPVFVALADTEALAGAEDADALAGAELLFAVDAEYCGEAVRGGACQTGCLDEAPQGYRARPEEGKDGAHPPVLLGGIQPQLEEDRRDVLGAARP